MVILDGLLEQHMSLRPTTLVTDSVSFSDIVFGPFLLLGYRFCARLANLGDTRFYRINTDLLARNWDDLLRVAGSLNSVWSVATI